MGEPTQKSIDDGAGLEQIRQRAEAHAVRMISGPAAVWSLEVGPYGRNERATAVRKHEHQMQLIAPMGPAQHGQGPAFKRMTHAGDRNARRDTLEMGSVWPFPSTACGTTCCSPRWRAG